MVLEQTLADYFEDIATNNKLIAHTDNTKRYAVGQENADNLMKNVLGIDGYCLVFELLEGSLTNNIADTENEEVPFSLYIVKKLKQSDYHLRTQTFDGAKTIIRQILSKMYRDIGKRSLSANHPIYFLQKQSKNYIKIEGDMSAGVFGYRIDMNLKPTVDLSYTAGEWNY